MIPFDLTFIDKWKLNLKSLNKHRVERKFGNPESQVGFLAFINQVRI
jgi:hypothetical protein